MKHTLEKHAARYRKIRRGGTHILVDLGLIVLSVLVSLILVQTHVITEFLASAGEWQLAGTFVTGMFFTSVFTTAPAIATLGAISLTQPLLLTALLGAAGSVFGDPLIFRFVRDRVAADIIELLRERGVLRRVKKLFAFRHYRSLTILLAGLIIASPLPDELGIALLGFAHLKSRYFVYLSFVFNFIGILMIGLAARSFAGI